MSVSLLQSPDPLALTKGGRMLFRFEGTGRLAAPGVVAKYILFFEKPVPDETAITIRWNSQDHNFSFRTSPTTTSEFTAGDGSSSHIDALVTEFGGCYSISKDFQISRYDTTQLPGIVFTARAVGAAWNLTGSFPTTIGFGTNTVGADPLIRERYSIWIQVYVQKPGTLGTDLEADYALTISPMPVSDELGIAQFDIGEHLHNQLEADYPAWNAGTPSLSSLSSRKYYIRYAEAYGSPMEVGRIKTDLVRTAYLGGADYLHKADGGFALSRFKGATAEGDTALRYGSRTRTIFFDEPQYLTFLNTRAVQTGSLLQVKLVFDDETFQYTNTLLPAISVPQNGKVTYGVGPAQLDLASHVPAGKHLVEYTVQRISPQLAYQSVAYRYLVNYSHRPYRRYFGFVSSLGVIDTICTFGKGSSELSIFSEQAQIFQALPYAVEDGEFQDYAVSTQLKLEVASGWQHEPVLAGWQDFYRSPTRFHLTGGKALPISLAGKSIKLAKDGDTLFAHSFSLAYLWQEDFYTASEDAEYGDALPPPGFQTLGTVNITTAEVVHATDPSISSALRNLTDEQVAQILVKSNQPGPTGYGYITQAAGNELYRRLGQKIDASEIVNLVMATLDQLFGTQQATKSLYLGGNANLITRTEAAETPSDRGHYHEAVQADGSIVRSFSGQAASGARVTDIDGKRALEIRKLMILLGVERFDGAGTTAFFKQLGVVNPPAADGDDLYGRLRWDEKELKYILTARSAADVARDIIKNGDPAAFAAWLKPLMTTSATSNVSKPFEVKVIKCYDKPDEILTITGNTKFFPITPEMLGIAQYHGLNKPVSGLFPTLVGSDNKPDTVMVLSFPDANHFLIDYPADAGISGYTGGKLAINY